HGTGRGTGRPARRAANREAGCEAPAAGAGGGSTGTATDPVTADPAAEEQAPADRTADQYRTEAASPEAGSAAAEAAEAPETGARAEAGADGGARAARTGDPAAAFDALYSRHVRSLTRQTFLLTGHRGLAESAVRRAFHTAWERWPEVAVDRDPAGWVRACSHEYALSPWSRLRPGHHSPETYAGLPEDKECLDALLSLPPCYRRTLLLHDGIRLGLPETAAESEASTPATAGRLLHAREALAELLPVVRETEPEQRGELIGTLLRRVAAAQPVRTVPARIVRTGSERQSRRWILAACGLTVAVVTATSFTVATTESGTLIPQVLPAMLDELSR
ncbi:SigE family RNA polymerase sigma factor, partial [Streptomyces sparsus]